MSFTMSKWTSCSWHSSMERQVSCGRPQLIGVQDLVWFCLGFRTIVILILVLVEVKWWNTDNNKGWLFSHKMYEMGSCSWTLLRVLWMTTTFSELFGELWLKNRREEIWNKNCILGKERRNKQEMVLCWLKWRRYSVAYREKVNLHASHSDYIGITLISLACHNFKVALEFLKLFIGLEVLLFSNIWCYFVFRSPSLQTISKSNCM